MMKQIKIVGIAGSLVPPSHSLLAVEIALDQAAKQEGVTTTLIDIGALNLPLYNNQIATPEAALQLANQVYEADALIWGTPLYHGTVSGLFKNTIDWLQLLSDRQPAYLTDKIVGLVSTAGGVQGLQAINTMEYIVRALRGWTLPFVVPISRAWSIFDKEGNLNDDKVRKQLEDFGEELVRVLR